MSFIDLRIRDLHCLKKIYGKDRDRLYASNNLNDIQKMLLTK